MNIGFRGNCTLYLHISGQAVIFISSLTVKFTGISKSVVDCMALGCMASGCIAMGRFGRMVASGRMAALGRMAASGHMVACVPSGKATGGPATLVMSGQANKPSVD